MISGACATGKTQTANAAGLIATGTGVCVNRSAFEKEDYSFIRSITASRTNEYERVSGTSFIEQWRGGKKSRFTSSTSIQTATLKTIWEYGVVKRQRCVKRATSKVESVTDVVLYDKAMIILADEFHACPTLKWRLLIYHIPDCRWQNEPLDDNKTRQLLDAKRLTHYFSLTRFHISEAINRKTIGLEIKENCMTEDMDIYEIELTFKRMDQVLREMGYERMLTMSVRRQITYFAEVLSHWRAVMEVHGFSHRETETSFLRQLLKDKENLGRLSDEQRAKMVEKRSVLDPSDLLSAATMVLNFSDHSHEVLQAQKESKVRTFVRKTLCKYMTDMSTMLGFDREKCYETQKREDAFFFQENCADEEFWTDLECTRHDTFYRHVTFNRRTRLGESCVSYVPGHRYNKLAYKQLLSTGKVQQMRQQFQPIQFEKELKEAVCLEAKEQASGNTFVPLHFDGQLLPYPDSLIDTV